MKEICKEDLVTTGSELFVPKVRKKITERDNTIEDQYKQSFFIQASDWEVWGQIRQELVHPIQQAQTTKKIQESNKEQPTNQFQKRQSDPK